jgi:hypothetical protein
MFDVKETFDSSIARSLDLHIQLLYLNTRSNQSKHWSQKTAMVELTITAAVYF